MIDHADLGEKYNKTRFISTSELEGLNGSYHLYGNPKLVELIIHPLSGGRFEVKTKRGLILLRPHDCVGVEQYTGEIFLVPGPCRHDNPFRVIVAQTRLSQRLLKFTNRIIRYDPTCVAISFNRRAPEDKQVTIHPWHERCGIGGKDIVVVRYPKMARDIRAICVRSFASHQAAEWLRSFLEDQACFRAPSGALDFARAQ